ncbi:MAG: MTH1187 family thiamine-binding protein [Desulfobulbaceae bacterium]|nr:MTH1187 family thiamine-binding protein [Desulfobulbaceae bacterium]
MALLQLTVIPLGTTTSVGDHVADIQKILAAEGVPFTLNDMGTVIEGETANLLKLATKLHEVPFTNGAQRVMTQIVIDDRRDKNVGIGDKCAAIKNRLD